MVALLDIWVLDRMLAPTDEADLAVTLPASRNNPKETPARGNSDHTSSSKATPYTPDRLQSIASAKALFKVSPAAQTPETAASSQYEAEDSVVFQQTAPGVSSYVDTVSPWQSPLKGSESNRDGPGEAQLHVLQPTRSRSPTRPLPRRVLLRNSPGPSPLKGAISPVQPRLKDASYDPASSWLPDKILSAAERLGELLAFQGCMIQLTSMYSEMQDLTYRLTIILDAQERQSEKAAIIVQRSFRHFRNAKQRRLDYVVQVQSWLRMVLCRYQWHRQQHSTRVIQRALSFALERKRLVAASTVVQSFYRGHRTRRVFVSQLSEIVKIQTAVRMRVAGGKFKRYLKATKCLQQWFLSLKRERQYRATTTIQRTVRGYHARRKFEDRQSAIVTIQSIARMRVALETLQRHLKAIKCLQRWFLSLKRERQYRATTTIQRAARGYYARRKFEHYRFAVTKVQSAVRMRVARETLQRHLKVTRCIQLWFLSVRRERQYRATTTIQRTVRGYDARRKFEDHRSAVTKIQAVVRMRVARKMFQRHLEATRCIQQLFLSVIRERQYWASTTIQRATRGYYARRKFEHYRFAVTKIQSIARMRVPRDTLQRHLKAIKCLQRWFLSVRRERQYWASTTIQRAMRGYDARRKFEDHRSAVTKIQTVVRMRVARGTLQKHLTAARYLQQWCLGLKRKRQISACTSLQQYSRGYLARRAFDKKNVSVAKLQSFIRVRASRKQFLRLVAACIVIQGYVRGHQARQNFETQMTGIVKMQAITRARRERRQYVLSENAAIRIQTFQRSIFASQLLVKRQESIQTLQREVRRYLSILRENLKQQHARTTAAITIQATFRTRMLQKHYQLQRLSVIYIQQNYRLHLRMVFEQTAAALIQNIYRCYCSRQRTALVRRTTEFQKHRAATVVQTFYRSRSDQGKYLRQRSAAIVLQNWSWSAARGFLTLRDQGMAPAYYLAQIEDSHSDSDIPSLLDSVTTEESVEILQSFARSFLARRKRFACLLVVGQQSDDRRGNRMLEDLAARSIQQWYRARNNYRSAAAVTIQRNYRGQTARSHRLLEPQNTAAGIIQDALHRSLLNQEVKLQRQVKLSILRAFGELSSRRHSAATTLQLAFRRHRDARTSSKSMDMPE
jgi:hypothetical protein